MGIQQEGVLKVLFELAAGKGWEERAHFLPKQVRTALHKISSINMDFAGLVSLAFPQWNLYHYSWLIDILKNIPKDQLPLWVGALPAAMRSRLEDLLKMPSDQHQKASPVLKKWMSKALWDKFIPAEYCPLPLLPPTSALPLLQAKKEALLDLIDLLSIHDLSLELRTVIDPQVHTRLSALLTKKQRSYLPVCLQKKEPVKIRAWKLLEKEKKADLFKHALHQCGLVRLGLALAGETPTYLWHISHILDSGRGALLLSFASKTTTPQVVIALKQQVMEIFGQHLKSP